MKIRKIRVINGTCWNVFLGKGIFSHDIKKQAVIKAITYQPFYKLERS